jgi:hypothetical protein
MAPTTDTETDIDVPNYPSTGCSTCDMIRRMKEDPNRRCLRHDPRIPQAERQKLGVKFETLVAGDHGKPAEPTISEKGKPMDQKQQNETAKSNKENRGVTPKATAMWPFVTRTAPKYENKGEEYKITLLFDPTNNSEHKNFLSKLRVLMEECGKQFNIKCRHAPTRPHLDPETKEKTALWEVTFRSDAKYAPRLFDAQNHLLIGETNMGNGSQVKVAYSYKFYKEQGGVVKLYLSAVQIIELKEYLGSNAESYGFATEQGYNATEKFGNEFGEQGPPPTDDTAAANTPKEEEIPF